MIRKNFISLLFFSITSFCYSQIDRSIIPKPGPPPSIEIGDPVEFELENGLKVLLVENNKLPAVTASLILDNKPYPGDEKNGTYSMTSALLGKETKNLKKGKLTQKIDFLGASLNVGAGGAFVSSLSKYFEEVLGIMADAILNPKFRQKEFEKEKNKIIEIINSNSKSVTQIARRVERVLSFGKNHPSGKYVTKETLNNVNLDDVKEFYSQNLIPNNAYLIIIGDFQSDKVKKLVINLFKNWKKKTQPNRNWNSSPNNTKLKIHFVDVPNAIQSEIVFQNKISLKMNDPDYFPVIIANKILGGAPEDRLEKQLREVKGYTYSARSSVGTSKYMQTRFRAYTSTRFQVTDSAVIELLKEIKKIREIPVKDDELENVKIKYAGNFVLNSESPSTIANYALNIKTQGLNKDFYKTYLANINRVTKSDILRVAKKYFNINQGQIVISGKGTELIDKLKNVKFEGKTIPFETYDQFGNKMEISN